MRRSHLQLRGVEKQPVQQLSACRLCICACVHMCVRVCLSLLMGIKRKTKYNLWSFFFLLRKEKSVKIDVSAVTHVVVSHFLSL